ncbi:hypothetical protein [Pseudomonas viridiflava]|uniref:hypothetical protein n=1 Tax=Pseudomonas viridiflava TaxID=33069 RepID=UPI000F03123B|nr:hypothetical protein [Pseudomonas viridiflava]
MNKLQLDTKTLALLKAQVRLTGTFNHSLRSASSGSLPFRLNVEHTSDKTRFIVEMGGQRHSLTLPNSKSMHLKLAAFIEDIAKGQVASNLQENLNAPLRTHAAANILDEHTSAQIFNLIRRGGGLNLDPGIGLPLHIAVHRNRTRPAVTTVMSIGVSPPRTKCFTVTGTDAEMFEQIVESIHHLVSVASPAARAA